MKIDKTKYMSITEYAKARGITTETLRHYDRIGLVKADLRDEKTGTRYYSIAISDDKMGTIEELKQLGLSLDEIKDFFVDRNAEKSIKILKKKKAELDSKFNSMESIQKVFGRRISALEKLLHQEYDVDKIWLSYRPERRIYYSDNISYNVDSRNKEAISLERILTELAPIMGGGRYVHAFSHKDLDSEMPACRVGLLLGDELEEDHIEVIPAGNFVCKYVAGHPDDTLKGTGELLEYCRKHKYEITSLIYKIFIVVMSVTDVEEENISMLQVRVK